MDEISLRTLYNARQMEEEKRKRKEREKEIEAEIRAVETYLTDEQYEKRNFCTEKSGDFAISGNAIYMLYQVLHQVDVERQEILDLLGNGSKKHYDVFSMNKQDQERMEYCREWLGVGEAEVYAIGIEIYWQYFTQ